MCPSDPPSPKKHTFWGGLDPVNTPTQGFSGNYVVNAGSSFFNDSSYLKSANLDGVMFALSKTTLTDITDGLSNTALVSELILVDDDQSARHPRPLLQPGPQRRGVQHPIATEHPRSGPVQLVLQLPPPQAPCVWGGDFIFVLARSSPRGRGQHGDVRRVGSVHPQLGQPRGIQGPRQSKRRRSNPWRPVTEQQPCTGTSSRFWPALR